MKNVLITRKEDKQKLVENTVNLAMKISDENKKDFVIAGVIAIAHKFLDEKYLEKVKGWLKMTSLGRMFEEEKLEAIKKTIEQKDKEKEEALRLKEMEKEKALKIREMEKELEKEKALREKELEKEEALREKDKRFVRTMLANGYEIIDIMDATGLTRAQIEEYK